MDDVAIVKQKTDIVAIIDEQVKLVRAGRHFKGLCPFHEERTPSFMVSPELQIFKCFGCGKSGDVFTFLQEYEGMEFYEALKYLADRVGVKLTPRRGQDTSVKTQIIEANELAAKFYHYILTRHPLGKPGLEYLTKERGLKKATIEKFQLGFAPQKSLLVTSLAKRNIKGDILEKAGLVFKARDGYIDRFRERVIFPISNPRGEVIALAGRILPQFDKGKVGKYINSPQTLVYHKSSSLYGMEATKDAIRKTRTAVVVEGELDFLSSWQAGVKNIIAIKGTAMTAEHVRILGRFAETLIMALDADFAGDTAAIRGLALAQNTGLEIKVANLGKYKDPDEFARADSSGFKEALGVAVDAWEFVINVIAKRYDLSTGSGKARASRQIVPILSSIEDSIVRAHYAQKAAGKLGVPVEAVAREVGRSPALSGEAGEEEPKLVREEKSGREFWEERLMILFVNFVPRNATLKEVKDIVKNTVDIKILTQIEDYTGKNQAFDIKSFSAKLSPELAGRFSDLVLAARVEDERNFTREFNMLVRRIKEFDLKDEQESLRTEMIKAEKEGKKKQLSTLQRQFQEVSRKRAKLTQEA
jgi:DNA primase